MDRDHDLSGAEFRSSSHSANGGQCIQPATNLHVARGIVPVRDSKDRHGPVLVFPARAWAAFCAATAAGEFGEI
ncbi:DUF397 domain-containing protein [Kitasatospora sp. NPDC057198]|uniref:DUF397 domain-containing protein n=1 Tax=Kitasatospora sp. NPDC057198 TaxID=3346046 RepID=UPI003628D699